MIAVLSCQQDTAQKASVIAVHETLDNAKRFILENLEASLENYRWIEFSPGDMFGDFCWDKANEFHEDIKVYPTLAGFMEFCEENNFLEDSKVSVWMAICEYADYIVERNEDKCLYSCLHCLPDDEGKPFCSKCRECITHNFAHFDNEL